MRRGLRFRVFEAESYEKVCWKVLKLEIQGLEESLPRSTTAPPIDTPSAGIQGCRGAKNFHGIDDGFQVLSFVRRGLGSQGCCALGFRVQGASRAQGCSADLLLYTNSLCVLVIVWGRYVWGLLGSPAKKNRTSTDNHGLLFLEWEHHSCDSLVVFDSSTHLMYRKLLVGAIMCQRVT